MLSYRKMFWSLLAAFSIMAGLSASPVSAVEKEKPAKTEKIDVNSATAKEMEDTLDGIGPAFAKKIVEGRPYKTIDDLVKAGIPEKTAEKIAPHITFGKVKADKKEAKEDKKEDTKVAKTDKKEKDDTEAKVPPKKGMVWVNTKSKVYHTEGDRYYGKTKEGEFMTEEDAIKSGAHKSKQD